MRRRHLSGGNTPAHALPEEDPVAGDAGNSSATAKNS
ncbi:hypothetical protein A2U01_0081443, partial [Trifolium medium]|nr:hypothetical protein [Trifolium medium]